MVSLSALGGPYVFAEVSRGRGQCPLSGVGRCPPLGGFLSTSSMGMSIGARSLSAVGRLSASRRVRY